jgi:hypothetical protein
MLPLERNFRLVKALNRASPLPPGEGQGEGINNEVLGKEVTPTGY